MTDTLIFPDLSTEDYQDCLVRGRLQREIGEHIVDQMGIDKALEGLAQMRLEQPTPAPESA